MDDISLKIQEYLGLAKAKILIMSDEITELIEGGYCGCETYDELVFGASELLISIIFVDKSDYGLVPIYYTPNFLDGTFYPLTDEEKLLRLIAFLDVFIDRYNLYGVLPYEFPGYYIRNNITIVYNGSVINIIGSLEDPNDLPNTGNPGDIWIVNGDIYIWTNLGWYNFTTVNGGIEWVEVTNDVIAVRDTGYITNKTSGTLIVTLPEEGSKFVVRVANKGTDGWRVLPPAGGTISWIDEVGITELQSTKIHDAVELLSVSPGNYVVLSSIGNIQFTN